MFNKLEHPVSLLLARRFKSFPANVVTLGTKPEYECSKYFSHIGVAMKTLVTSKTTQ